MLAQIVPISKATKRLQAAMVDAHIVHSATLGDADLAFMVDMPPLQLATVSVQPTSKDDPHAAKPSIIHTFALPDMLCPTGKFTGLRYMGPAVDDTQMRDAQLAFMVDMPPLQLATVSVQPTSKDDPHAAKPSIIHTCALPDMLCPTGKFTGLRYMRPAVHETQMRDAQSAFMVDTPPLQLTTVSMQPTFKDDSHAAKPSIIHMCVMPAVPGPAACQQLPSSTPSAYVKLNPSF